MLVLLIRPSEIIGDWRRRATPPVGVRWIDVHSTYDLVSTSQALLHTNDGSHLYTIGQSGWLQDHVKYFQNSASFLPLLLSALIDWDDALAEQVDGRAVSARRVFRAAVNSATSLRSLFIVLAIFALVRGIGRIWPLCRRRVSRRLVADSGGAARRR